ncbi:MAG: Fur family transcriptional regulator [Anaerolineae bacterium]|nr:transcriptional repressor [Thermoflexales bacterium]MDW8407117.1 Fur family transcriptional regulator [Anaerolineae bacterium]
MNAPRILEQTLSRLREQGERLTRPRRKVLEVLNQSGDHLTVNDVQRALQQAGEEMDAATVYRVLQWLKRVGLISQTDLGGEAIVYQIIDDHRHHHLVCLSCGSIVELSDDVLDPLRRTLRRDYDFEPRIDHLALFGLCKRCRTQGSLRPALQDVQTGQRS